MVKVLTTMTIFRSSMAKKQGRDKYVCTFINITYRLRKVVNIIMNFIIYFLTCLAIGEDSTVVPLHHLVDQRLHHCPDN